MARGCRARVALAPLATFKALKARGLGRRLHRPGLRLLTAQRRAGDTDRPATGRSTFAPGPEGRLPRPTSCSGQNLPLVVDGGRLNPALDNDSRGAVRAMEVDINYEWTTFNFDGTFGARDPTKLVPGMARLATRYLSPDDRDIFALYAP